MTTKLIDLVRDKFQTTGNTATDTIVYTLPDGCGAYVTARAVAKQAGGSTLTKGLKTSQCFERTSGGAAAASGAAFDSVSGGGLGAVVLAFRTTGNTVIVQVTGLAVTTIDWWVELEVMLYIP